VATVASTESEAPAAPSPAVTPPPGNPRFPLFDGLRAMAVLAVVTFHVTSLTGAVDTRVIGDVFAVLGNQGLILFFVISGFLLYRPFVAARVQGTQRVSTLRYARRRALRIVPAYWTALTALAIFPGIVGVFTGDWWRYYFFLQLYSTRTLDEGIPVAWTLCVEVSFYIALPIWAIVMRRLRLVSGPSSWLRTELLALVALASLGAVIQILAARQILSNAVADSLLGECIWFALGMALAVASVAESRTMQRAWAVRMVTEYSLACWIGAAACLIGVAAVLHPGGLLHIILALRTKQPIARTLASILLTGALMTLLVAPAVFGERAGGLPRRILRAAPIAWVGLVSYGVYLWHLPIAELLALRADAQHFSASGLGLGAELHHRATPVLFLLTLGVTVLVAAASYYVVELPFLRRKEG
jgi:peptidoglycan/LPS O-acetylase OafA/YrhL